MRAYTPHICVYTQIVFPRVDLDFENTYMAALVNSHETERAALFDLAVNNAIRR